MNAVLFEIVSCEVGDMPHNIVGGKTKSIAAFMSRIASETEFTEFQPSTLADIYSNFQKIWGPMAKEYETMAEALYAQESPEYANREKLQLIKNSEERTDEYSDVIFFPTVDAMVSMKTPFRFSSKDIVIPHYDIDH